MNTFLNHRHLRFSFIFQLFGNVQKKHKKEKVEKNVITPVENDITMTKMGMLTRQVSVMVYLSFYFIDVM